MNRAGDESARHALLDAMRRMHRSLTADDAAGWSAALEDRRRSLEALGRHPREFAAAGDPWTEELRRLESAVLGLAGDKLAAVGEELGELRTSRARLVRPPTAEPTPRYVSRRA